MNHLHVAPKSESGHEQLRRMDRPASRREMQKLIHPQITPMTQIYLAGADGVAQQERDVGPVPSPGGKRRRRVGDPASKGIDRTARRDET